MRKALQFGAGNVGRGFIGLLLSQSGYQVVFVDIIEPLVDLMNRQRGYTVRVVGPDGREKETTVKNVTAINAREEEALVEELSRATLITTAVGLGALQTIAPIVARGLQRRADLNLQAPLNIIACENLIDTSKVLQQYILTHLPAGYRHYVENRVGFPCCVVDRVVSALDSTEKEANPLTVVAEERFQFTVERCGFVGEPPAYQGYALNRQHSRLC